MLRRQATNPVALGGNLSLLTVLPLARRLSIAGYEDGQGAVAPKMKDVRSPPASRPAAPSPHFNFAGIPVATSAVQNAPTVSSSGEWFGPRGFPLQRKTTHRAYAERHRLKTNHSGHPLPFLDTIQKSFGHHDVSHVRAHTDNGAAAEAFAIGAEAFARGTDVSFARTPSLHTAAHEAAHVIQQLAGANVTGGMGGEGDAHERHADAVADRVARGESCEVLLDSHPGPEGSRDSAQSSMRARQIAGSSRPILQMRRIPPNIRALLTSSTGLNAPNFSANADGAQRLIDRAMAELTPADRANVLTNRRGALTEAQFSALARRERLSRHAEAIVALFPTRRLGDPTLLDVHPRPATADDANIAKVVTHANTIFTSIASGARDGWLTQVFGAGSIGPAKLKYAAARTRMNQLHASKDVVTDRGSGFSAEVFEGGLTGPNQISVAPSVIDNPDNNNSITTFIHESMHAGNANVHDDVYITATGFTTQPEAAKLLNAAHFEVVPWRILAPTNANAFPVSPPTVPPTFQTFIPAGTTVGGVTAPARTSAEEGAVAAYQRMRRAWALGLNLHRQYVHLFRTPTDWTVPQFGGTVHYPNSIPFWSKVQKLTIHTKPVIDPMSSTEAKHPISQIDVALSEGLTRKVALAAFLELDPLKTHAQILAFEAANSTPAERSAAFPGGAHTNINTERDFLLKLAVRSPRVAPMTGSVARDFRVVRQQGDPTLSLWSDILKPRNPASFPD